MPDYEQGYEDGFRDAKNEDNQALNEARAAVKELKHLQQYEGHQKAESDKIGHKIETQLLRTKINELTAELEKLRAAH